MLILVPLVTGVLAAAFALAWWFCCKRVDDAIRSLYDLTPQDLDF